jgi:coatomer protein complex subunit gamma
MARHFIQNIFQSSVDRMMKHIATFVLNECKIVVVQAIRLLCMKFPRKYGVLTNFLSSLLLDKDGLEYKAVIVDTIITMIEDNWEAEEAAGWFHST